MTQPLPTALDALLNKLVSTGGVPMPPRPVLNFTGSGVVVTDDPVNGQTNVAIAGGTGSLTSLVVSTSLALGAGDDLIYVQTDIASANVVLTLPQPSLRLAAQRSEILIKDIGNNAATHNIQLWPFGPELIEGVAYAGGGAPFLAINTNQGSIHLSVDPVHLNWWLS